ncbi:hypothetical protein VDGE_07992 [Verticillium dahliae]|uniref:Uncharacterized protein n=1 Tax=Verticillium dahliae TaxID=27337 RepID=A0A444S605_VERDA|nr:hypothetical protein VDGE_07992 [Verticillium dahliae]
MPIPSPEDRQRRLLQLAEQWGVELPPTTSSLSRPSHPPTYRNTDDDFYAEELVKRRQLSHGRTESTGNLRKAFSSSKKKSYDPKIVFDALNSHVANSGRAGAAESLINLLISSGGDVNLPQKPKPGLLSRRKSLETFGERSRLLQQAVQNGQADMVAVLLPHADAVALDTSLPIAMRNQNTAIVELLLRYGAGAASTADAQDAVRQACVTGGQAEIVSLVLRSEGRPSASWLSQCMIDATRAACVSTVVRLAGSTADGNHNQAQALKIAISQGRHDIVLAILLGSKPPRGQGLDEAFTELIGHPSINPNDKISMVEMLLCAGAEGDGPSLALLDSASAEFLEMLHVLVTYGTSIEYRDAMAVRKAISSGRVDVAHILLAGNSPLSSLQASECVELIPKDLASDHRRLLLDVLLRRGASGNPLHAVLIEAVRAGDVKSVNLLVTPQFPGSGRPVESQSPRGLGRRASKSMVFERHEVASVDYKNGLALQIAVGRGDVPMASVLLASKPSGQTVARVFAETSALPPRDKLAMVECFLSNGLPPQTVQDALQEAIDSQPPNRDEALIALLLRFTNDVNSSDGALLAAVTQKDVKLLAALLRKNISPDTAAGVLPSIVAIEDPRARLEIASLVLSSVPGMDPAKVSSAMLHVLNTQPADMRLLQVLLQQGRADINFHDGAPLSIAIRDHEPPVLDTVLKHSKPSAATLNRALNELSQMPSSEKKVSKLHTLLRRTTDKALLNDILVKEVHSLVKTEPKSRQLSTVKVLLSSGADVNSHNAAALCHAVAASDEQLTNVLFEAKPTPASLAYALPHALRITDPMDRLAFSKKLLEAGAPSAEANRALGFAINTYSDDLPLLRTLSVKANTNDGEALVAAIRRERPDIVELVLQRKHTTAILNSAFTEATKCQKRDTRALLCTLLLKHGASGNAVSEALQAAATDGDIVLGNILINHGVGVDDQAIIEACRSGAADVLAMLLTGREPSRATLEQGFQAATEVGDLRKRAAVLEPLLTRGVGGDALNAQLVSAVRFGGEGEELVRILLQAGADPNYYNGEAVWAATRSANVGSLKTMLAVGHDENSRQPRASSVTLIRALNAAWKLSGSSRLLVLDMLFKAGLPVCEELHICLNKAVNDEAIDEKAIEILVAHGATPNVKGAKTLVDAAQRALPSVVRLLLEAPVTIDALNLTVVQSFTKDNAATWFSDRGFLVLQALILKGAQGAGLTNVLGLVINMVPQSPDLGGRFMDLLFENDVDVDHEDGKLLESATSTNNIRLVQRLLEKHPKTESLSKAFHHIFDQQLSEDEALQLIQVYTEYSNGETRLDVMYSLSDSPPVLFLALARFPRSFRIMKALLDAGFYHDQTTVSRVMPEIEEEETVTLLTWALIQPQKKVSSNIIQLLLDSGAKVNFETRHSRLTPLMLAIHARRPDVTKELLLKDADVDVTDAKGNTPLSLASDIGGDVAITIMSNLLAAGASRNDGSLQNAARELNLAAVQVLVEYGHDPDFPSHLHDGRSALGEMCLHGAMPGEMTAAHEKQIERVMNFLLDKGSDISVKCSGKSLLHLALESSDPVAMTRLLLKVGMWKLINKKFNLYRDGVYTYSPTMYVAKVLPKADVNEQLLRLLRANRCEDVFFANRGPQPDDATGLPDDVALQERERRARLSRLASEQEDYEVSIARSKELAAVQAQIWANQAELEDARRKRAHSEEMQAMGDRARAEEEAFAAAMRRRQNERASEASHEKAMAEASALKARQEMELDKRRHLQALDWERNMATERVDHAKALSALRIAEREDVERMDRQQDERATRRIAEQRRLVESQSGLAGQLAGVGPQGRRQIGYVAGELNN